MFMTSISRNNMGFLGGGEKTPEELVEFLKNGAMLRQFHQILGEAYPKEDILQRLSRGLSEINGEPLPNTTRRVQNWLNGRSTPQNREILFQICFVLGLNEEHASRLLASASETGLHYRSPSELVYAFGLRTGMNYADTVSLKEKILGKYLPEIKEKHRPDDMAGIVYTRQIRDAFAGVTDERKLMEFFDAHAAQLGRLHETAYSKFAELMALLQKPDCMNGCEERRYTVEKVMNTYMRMHVPETKKTSDYTLLQKVVKKYWPNESSLLDMLNRKEDVSRKALLLLYLVTEEFGTQAYCEEEDPDTLLEMRLKLMNLFLDKYGMRVLDAGNPFDLLVIYAMGAQEGEYMSDRMESVLEKLFNIREA